MKLSLVIFLTLFSTKHYARFAQEVFQRPCDLIVLEVKECTPKTFSNRNELKQQRNIDTPFPEKSILTYQGIVVKGAVLQSSPTKCDKNQKIKLSQYRPLVVGMKDFFIHKGKCPKIKGNSLSFVVTKQFCDTPGAISVPECYIQKIKRENNVHFANQVKY